MRHTKTILLSLMLLMSTLLVACGGASEETDAAEGSTSTAKKQEINLVETAEIPSMDSSMTIDAIASQWLGSTKDGLYRLGNDGQPEPGMARSHEVSEDGLTYTFDLREGAKWSNGDEVTAKDFVFAWRRAVNPATGSEYGPYMMNGVIKNAEAVSKGEMELDQLGVVAVDDYTLEVTLEKPTPYFKSMTAFGTFLPQNQSFVEEQGDKYALDAETLLSNGPFIMTEWNHGAGWTVEKNEDYWDADNVKLEKINVKVVKDVAAGVNLYQTDAVDRVNLSSEFVDEYRSSEDFHVAKAPTTFFIKMNQENEILSNAKARKAIQHVIDRQSMVNVILNNGSVVADGMMPSDFVKHPETGEDFTELNDDLVEQNVEEAQKLWSEAKQELGIETAELRFLGGDTEVSKNLDAYLKAQLEQLEGLTIQLESVPFKVRLERDKNMDYDLENYGWGPDYLDPNTFLNLWVTDGGSNKTGYSSEEYDSLISQAGDELAQQPVKRFEAFLEAERLLIEEDAVLAPLYQRAHAQLWDPSVKNVTPNAMGPDYTYKYAYVE
ncbi:peptide ABC transporter substrate-binding protein [Halobacillus locisalis]|uniref:Peptide ABC transporter substrate-binding protein n=2 Tax=Halobacillus locisalis TaxID=220753 RepID=A0A838CPK0_9BACI|nr:peptide ABC transporter substrate-binding protein [Halobacillus locisalis]MBA2173788.1 peptide ABC transporter substrate-binding protein [Halobacillus locisalis]